MRKLLFIIPLLIFITACSNASPEGGSPTEAAGTAVVDTTSPSPSQAQQPSQPPPETIVESEMWRVELLNAELAESLTATLAAVQYGGGILETTSEVTPSGGHLFLLIELRIEKIGTGRASFSWGDAHIEDSTGNTYYRHYNDTFLANLNIPRLRGTDIVLGNESGYACFEIPRTAEGLRFVADEGNIVIEVIV